MESNEEDDVLFDQPTTLEERFAVARAGVERMRLTLPVLVDGMDDAVGEAFAAWPERIFVADTDGVIAFRTEPGPWGFDPEAAVTALETTLDG